MKFLAWFRILRAAYNYKFKGDIGGIEYLESRLAEGNVAIDIGTHRGEYLYFMQKLVGKAGRVYAFEPQKRLYENLLQTKRYLKWHHVSVERTALSNERGSTALYVPGASFDASIRKEVVKTVRSTEVVEMTTLDWYCNEYSIKPHFVKVDVEGNEYNVLMGGIGMLRECKPKLLIEIEARHVGERRVSETFELLQDIGYVGSFIEWNRLQPLKDFRFSTHQNLSNLWSSTRLKPYCNNFVFESLPKF